MDTMPAPKIGCLIVDDTLQTMQTTLAAGMVHVQSPEELTWPRFVPQHRFAYTIATRMLVDLGAVASLLCTKQQLRQELHSETTMLSRQPNISHTAFLTVSAEMS